MCGKKGHFARDCWSRAHYDKSVNKVEIDKVNAETGREFVFTIENVISDVTLSQNGCEEHEDGLVMIDSGASANVCSKLFGKSKMPQFDGAIRLRSADGRQLQENGKGQTWQRIGRQTKRYDFQVVDVTEPTLSVSYLCEQGVETHLAKQTFLKFGDRQEPLIRRGGMYFVKTHTVNAVEAVEKAKSAKPCVQPGDAQKWHVQPRNPQKWSVQPEE